MRYVVILLFLSSCSWSLFTTNPDCFRSETPSECLNYCRDDIPDVQICFIHVNYLEKMKELAKQKSFYEQECLLAGQTYIPELQESFLQEKVNVEKEND